jgi:hypothetical protein
MWLHHLVNLLASVLSIFVESIGTTWLGLWLGVAFGLATILASMWHIRRKHGRDAMVKHWEENAKIALRVSIVCASIVYLPIFLWSVGKAVYEDHRYLVGYTKIQKENARRDVTIFDEERKESEKQIGDWRTKCAGFESAKDVLTTQNRDQQNTINNCQTQALHLLQQPDLKITPVRIEDFIDPDPNRGRKTIYVVLTNRKLSPVHLNISCDRELLTISTARLDGAAGIGSSVKTMRTMEVVLIMPTWSPEIPIIVDLYYFSGPQIHCEFRQE